MNEFGYGLEQEEGTPQAMWRDRLMHIAGLIDQGLLGRLVGGESHQGWSVEAVRTELPFFHRERLSMEEEPMQALVSPTLRDGAELLAVNMDFSGRADLVLALVNASGEGALQVVDLKTRGCLKTFNEKNPKKGHVLQRIGPDNLDVAPQSDEETQLLHEHRLQLTLYSLALQAIEDRKPEDERRTVLPPALLLGANGRLVQLTQSEYDDAIDDLRAHLMWRSAVHLNPLMEEPERLPSGSASCRTCPFFRGDLRRCAPQGEPLGFVKHLDDVP